jgi:hypothetical protein
LAITFFALLLALSISLPAGRSAKPGVQDNSPQAPLLTAEGAKVIRLKDSQMGLPKSALPGAKFITFAQWKDMKEIPKTGLYLVDMSFVPPGLPEHLKAYEGYILEQDGTLRDQSGKPIAVFIKTDYFQLQAEKKTARQRTSSTLRNSFAPAPPGNPYDFRCVAVSGWSVYHGGFCRDYDARTYADAYGLDERGGCSRSSPHTRIESIETRAEIRGRRDLDTCRGCERASSRARWDLGCWWPRDGGASSFHFVNLFDLGIRFTRAWTFTA